MSRDSSPALATEPPMAAFGASGEPCGELCPLKACKNGHRALVVRVDCASAEACRLRALGVYEGARLAVVEESRNGLLLQVRGSRLAIGAAVAAAITVIPIAP
jgi:Fe2+ transport system protein FeoA